MLRKSTPLLCNPRGKQTFANVHFVDNNRGAHLLVRAKRRGLVDRDLTPPGRGTLTTFTALVVAAVDDDDDDVVVGVAVDALVGGLIDELSAL